MKRDEAEDKTSPLQLHGLKMVADRNVFSYRFVYIIVTNENAATKSLSPPIPTRPTARQNLINLRKHF